MKEKDYLQVNDLNVLKSMFHKANEKLMKRESRIQRAEKVNEFMEKYSFLLGLLPMGLGAMMGLFMLATKTYPLGLVIASLAIFSVPTVIMLGNAVGEALNVHFCEKLRPHVENMKQRIDNLELEAALKENAQSKEENNYQIMDHAKENENKSQTNLKPNHKNLKEKNEKEDTRDFG